MVALTSRWLCFWLSIRRVNKLVNGTDERHDRTHTHRLLPKTGLSRNTENSQQTVHKASTVWFPGFPKGTLDESRSSVATGNDPRAAAVVPAAAAAAAFRASVKLDHVLGIDLVAVEDDVNLWIGHVVHAAVVEAGEAGVLGGRSAVHGVPHRVLPHQNSGQEHGFVGRLAGKDGRGQPVSLQGDVVLPRGVTEFTGVFGVPGKIAPCSGTMVLAAFVMSRQKREGFTFAVHAAVAPREPPVEVKSAYSLNVTVSCSVEEHSLLDVQRALDLLQLRLLPEERRRERLIASKCVSERQRCGFHVTSQSAKCFSKQEALR